MPDERPIRMTTLARGRRAEVSDVKCRHRAQPRLAEERHTGWTIALVTRGEFLYRPHDEQAPRALRPGWLFLGREGAGYECGHEHDGGDDCFALHLDGALLDDVARDAAGPGPALTCGAAPPIPSVVGAMTVAARALARGEPIDADALAVDVAARVVSALHGRRVAAPTASAGDRERVRAALDVLDARCDEEWPLGAIADHVGASPFHFARTFRAFVGTSPHQYLIGARLRRAMGLLLDTDRDVTRIAFDAGFGDLSNFVRTFHRQVGAPPGAFRLSAKKAPPTHPML
jgi:AraC-like DNA-binding protein